LIKQKEQELKNLISVKTKAATSATVDNFTNLTSNNNNNFNNNIIITENITSKNNGIGITNDIVPNNKPNLKITTTTDAIINPYLTNDIVPNNKPNLKITTTTDAIINPYLTKDPPKSARVLKNIPQKPTKLLTKPVINQNIFVTSNKEK